MKRANKVERRRRRLDGPGALLAEPLRASVTWSDTLSFVAQPRLPRRFGHGDNGLTYLTLAEHLLRASPIALRIYTARTGRDPVQELLRAWPPAGDSARLVIGTILRGAGALADRSSDDIAAALSSGSEADRRGASAELNDILQRLGRPAPDSLASSLLRPLLDALSSGAGMPWPDLDGQRTGIHSYVSGFHGVTSVPVFVLDENLAPGIPDEVLAPFSRITRQRWEARPLREGGVLVTFAPAIVWEDFVRLTLNWSAYERRAANEAPSGYAGGGSFTLLRTQNGWRIASVGMWIT